MNFKRTYERQKHLLLRNAANDLYDVALAYENKLEYKKSQWFYTLADLIGG